MGRKLSLKSREAVPALNLSPPVPKLHGRKTTFALGDVYGFHVIARMEIQGVCDAVVMVEE